MADIQVNRQTVISFPEDENLNDITTGIASGSLLIDEVLFTEGFTIGECNANRFEAELYNIPDISNKLIYVHQLIYEGEDDEEPTDVPLFTGRIDSCVRNRMREDIARKIVAYDALYYLRDKDVSAWWETLFNHTASVTVKQARESLCTYVGLSYDNTITLPNDSLQIQQTQQINSIGFVEVLKYFCKIQCCNANITRTGSIEFIRSYTEVVVPDTDFEINNSEYEAYTVPAYTKVKIVNTINEQEATAGEGNKTIVIQDNLLLLNKSSQDLQVIANVILQNMPSIPYTPANVKMILADPNIGIGNIVTTSNGSSLVCENELSGPMLIEQTLVSTGSENYDEDTTSGYEYSVTDEELKKNITANETKYYRLHNKDAITVGNLSTRAILTTRYAVKAQCLVIFQGVVILDAEAIDKTKPSEVEIQYEIGGEVIRTFTPTETYIDGRHTFNLMYYWDSEANVNTIFRVLLTCTNCTVNIGAFRIQGLMQGIGLLGDEVWDGYIDVEDTFTGINIDDSIAIATFTDDVEAELIIPTEIDETEDTFSGIMIDDSIEIATIDDRVFINKTSISAEHITWAELAELDWGEVYDKHLW